MIIMVQHRVKDFDAWKPVFDEDAKNRKSHGATGHIILRVLDDPNDVVVLNRFGSRQQAEAFAADPLLKEAMDRAGVVGEPHLTWAEEVENVEY